MCRSLLVNSQKDRERERERIVDLVIFNFEGNSFLVSVGIGVCPDRAVTSKERRSPCPFLPCSKISQRLKSMPDFYAVDKNKIFFCK